MAFDWKKTKKQISEHLSKTFLLSIRNEETFEETASYRLTLRNIYILLSTVVVSVGILLMLLLIVTPLKRLIPGYGDVRSQVEFIKLQKQLTSLEEEVLARNTYIEGVQRLLSGNPQTSADVTKNIVIAQEKADPIPKIKEDSILRLEYETNAKSKNPIRTNTSPPNMTALINQQFIGGKNAALDFFAPVNGTISEGFKPEKNHFGIDIIAPKNTPVKACLPGSVIQSDWTLESGYTIAIQHEQNFISIYKHNSALLKKTGNHVKAGEAIGIIGNTGELTSGIHAHFELWQNGRPVNPVLFIKI